MDTSKYDPISLLKMGGKILEKHHINRINPDMRTIYAKMSDDVSERIENVLNLIVCTAERSGNLKRELKQTIFETLITLKHLFVKLKDRRYGKSIAIGEL